MVAKIIAEIRFLCGATLYR